MVTTALTSHRGRPKGIPKTGGRQMGTPNKVIVEVRTWARSVVEDRRVHAKTREMARTGRLAPAILIELLHYAYGKPKDTMCVETPSDSLRPVDLFDFCEIPHQGPGGISETPAESTHSH